MKHFILTVGALLLMTGMAFAKDLATYTANYEKQLEAINHSRESKMVDLVQAYTNALSTLKERAKKAGDLDTVVAVLEEVARIKTDQHIPEKQSEVSGIRNLQLTFKKKEAKLRVDEARKIISLTAKYDQALERLQKTLVVSDKVGEAVDVRRERMRAQNAAIHIASKKTAASFAKTRPAKPEPKKRILRPPAKVSEATVTVDAKQEEWTGTGLLVKKSEYVRLKTSGEIQQGTAERHRGSEGKWLQIRFGDSEGIDAAGKKVRMKAPEDGEIFLRVYDVFYNDNTGEYVVEIKGDFEKMEPAEPVH